MDNNEIRNDLFPKAIRDKISAQETAGGPNNSSLASKVFSAPIVHESHRTAPTIFFLVIWALGIALGGLTNGLGDTTYLINTVAVAGIFTAIFIIIAKIIRAVGEHFGKVAAVILWVIVAALALGGLVWIIQS